MSANVVFSSITGNSLYGYGSYMYVATSTKIVRISTSNWSLTNWEAAVSKVMQMAIYGDYMYAVTGELNIVRITLKTGDVYSAWFQSNIGGEMCGIAISSDGVLYAPLNTSTSGHKYIYTCDLTATNLIIVKLDSTVDGLVDTYGVDLDDGGAYLYVTTGTGIARLDTSTNTFQSDWLTVQSIASSPSVVAYGDYLYVSCLDNSQVETKKILIAQPYMTDWVNTKYSVVYITVYGGYLYELTPNSIVQINIAQASVTLVYSQAALTASSKPTAQGKRGTALLRRPGKRRPVGFVEMVTRTSTVNVKRRAFSTTQADCTITFFDHPSAIKCPFVYTKSGAVSGRAIAASGVYDSANVTMTPNGDRMEITVTS